MTLTKNSNVIWDKLTHKWLRVPYTLHVHTNQLVKKPRATVLFIHGIGNSGGAWDEVIEALPDDLHLVTIDLLGFGQSARPAWAIYDAKTQARAVIATFFKMRITGRVIIVGHSLGSLVAVEIAKRYPLLVKSLVLCSPPFYKLDAVKQHLLPGGDKLLSDAYRLATRHPEEFVKISQVAKKLGLVNKSFSLTRDDAPSYMNALEATIINQTSLEDAVKLKLPIQILYGRLDPVVIAKNLKHLIKHNVYAQLTTILAGHEVKGSLFIKATTNAVNRAVDNHP